VTHFLLQLIGAKTANIQEEINTNRVIKSLSFSPLTLSLILPSFSQSAFDCVETFALINNDKDLLEDVQEYQGKLIAANCELKNKKEELEEKANRVSVCDLLMTTIDLIREHRQKKVSTPKSFVYGPKTPSDVK